MKSKPLLIPIDRIFADHSLQIRCQNDPDQVENLVEAMKAGAEIPPVDLYAKDDFADPSYLIGDGWHRYYAALSLRRKEIPAIVHAGGRSAAIKHALGANASHGLRRTNKDKRNAVRIALKEFPTLSARAIADLCKVSPNFAAQLKREVSSDDTSVTGQDGKTYPVAPRQIDFWDEINEVLKPIPKAIQSVCNGKWWIDPRIDIGKRIAAAKSLEDTFRRELDRIAELRANLNKEANKE